MPGQERQRFQQATGAEHRPSDAVPLKPELSSVATAAGAAQTTSVSRKRILVLFGVLAAVAVAAVGGWVAGSRIESPADAAARTAPPTPSPILVPVEERVLSSAIVTRGTARFGLPQPISIAPSALKASAGLITTLPLRNAQLGEGDAMLTASGRPVFLLQGQIPAYRDLVPGISGDDSRQLEQALERLGFDPGPMDGTYDARTSAAVAEWYKATGWEPFGPTRDQRARVRTLERDWADATRRKVETASAAAAADLAVRSARATAAHNNKVAAAELAARAADRRRLTETGENATPLAVEYERAKAKHARTAAAADVAAQIAERALIVLDPRQTETARAAADARVELARAAARKTQLEGELAIHAAEREARLATEQFELAKAAVTSTRLEGKIAIQAALDAQEIAKLDARLAADRADRLAGELAAARGKLGVQVPADEIVFLPALPVRVEEVTALVGDPARGSVMSVTDNQLAIDSALPLDAAPLVKPGMRVSIDEQALGVKATGVVKNVAGTPGTRGVDGYHIYFEIRVDETPTRLEGFSLRLTIPIESTEGAVTAVPTSALSLAADGTSRVQVEDNGALHYIVVEPGLSADGYVEVTPVDATLVPGQLVVIGYDSPHNEYLQ
jgi:peptidoglycan hydrolase-like protein with peptidoglycan-binding domain